MKIKKNIKLSKRLLFTSLAAVALLGATQPVLAWSTNPYEGHGWFRQDGEMINGSHWGEEESEAIKPVDYDHGRENVEDTSHDKVREYGEGREAGYRDGLLGELFPNTTDWPTEYKEGYLDGYGRGMNKRNNQGSGEDTSHDKVREYGEGREAGYRDGLLGELFPDTTGWPTEYKEGYLDGYGKGMNKHDNQGDEEGSQKPALPPVPESPWPENPRLTPQRNPQVSDYDRGLADGLETRRLGKGPDFASFKNKGWSEEYKKGYMKAFGTTYTPSIK
ncbi:hypothetical protein [Streptococcus dysgalactiae]|uniref:hypothetical protein n=1 Tax=Streptococcus dysgalactiae TaxID=1334 RepID=UPI00080709EB|nr:hypothetical protein [Streptococcus dysgalactiae]OBZ06367.1 hypothetical protein BBG02_03715 [Streptococcus dysgalactiae subsp. equisimilis]